MHITQHFLVVRNIFQGTAHRHLQRQHTVTTADGFYRAPAQSITMLWPLPHLFALMLGLCTLATFTLRRSIAYIEDSINHPEDHVSFSSPHICDTCQRIVNANETFVHQVEVKQAAKEQAAKEQAAKLAAGWKHDLDKPVVLQTAPCVCFVTLGALSTEFLKVDGILEMVL